MGFNFDDEGIKLKPPNRYQLYFIKEKQGDKVVTIVKHKTQYASFLAFLAP